MLPDPILYLSGYIIDHKTAYHRLLQEVRTEGNWPGWVLFILEGVEESAKEAIRQITAIRSLFDETLTQVRQQAPKV